MSAVENVFVAAAKAVAATLASVAAFTACQPVVASPVGAAIQVRAFHTPPRTDAQLASVASVVIHAVEDPAVWPAVHVPSGFESPSESLMHSACVKRSVAVGWLEAVAQVPHSPSTVAVVGELVVPSHLPGTVQKNAAMQAASVTETPSVQYPAIAVPSPRVGDKGYPGRPPTSPLSQL